MPDDSILTSSFVLWHRAKPQLVSSLIPKAASPQEALRHLEAECSNPRAGGTPRVDPAKLSVLYLHLLLLGLVDAALKADLRGGFQCEQFMWEEVRREGRSRKGCGHQGSVPQGPSRRWAGIRLKAGPLGGEEAGLFSTPSWPSPSEGRCRVPSDRERKCSWRVTSGLG